MVCLLTAHAAHVAKKSHPPGTDPRHPALDGGAGGRRFLVEEEPVAETSNGSVTKRGLAVLVVEDEADVREIMVRHLSELGCQVVTASTGLDAISVLHGEAPLDLVVTDVIMPGGMTGYGVADVAVAARPGIKVLFVSG